MEEKIKFLLNGLFNITEKRDTVNDPVGRASMNADIEYRYHNYQAVLEEAALDWMLLEIEQYLTLVTSRICTGVKVWKTVGNWNELDVYLNIQAKGRPASQFAVKTYVVFPKKDECLFKLEDWADGTRLSVKGRIMRSGKLLKCVRLISPPPENGPVSDSDDKVMV